jgi:hypothetical protein
MIEPFHIDLYCVHVYHKYDIRGGAYKALLAEDGVCGRDSHGLGGATALREPCNTVTLLIDMKNQIRKAVLIEAEEHDSEVLRISKEDIIQPTAIAGSTTRRTILEIRESGDFKDLGIWLGDYDWIIVEDNKGSLVLLKLKKGTLERDC